MIPEPVQSNIGPDQELISASRARADQGREQGREGKGSTSLSPSTPTSSTSTRQPRSDVDGQTIDLEAITAKELAGPWSWAVSADRHWAVVTSSGGTVVANCPDDDVAAAITHVPELVAEVKRLGQELADLQDAHGLLKRSHEFRTGQLDEARAEVERLTEDTARLRGTIDRQLGECTGCTTEPEETCPIDGRTYTEWVDIASEVIGRLNAERAEVKRLTAIVEAVEKALLQGGQSAAIRAQQALFVLSSVPGLSEASGDLG